MAATRSNIVALAASQVGIHGSRVKYQVWYANKHGAGWINALWCAIFISWLFDEKGDSDLIGGDTASTVTMLNRLGSRATRVSFANARSGDILLSRFGSAGGGRADNVVNHVDIVTGSYRNGGVPVIGGNTPRPGSVGDPTNGRGVWRHTRYASTTVAVYRPHYASSGGGSTVLKKGDRGKAVKTLQAIVGADTDGIFGNGTEKHTKDTQRLLKFAGLYHGKIDGRWGNGSKRAYRKFVDGKKGPVTIKVWQHNAKTPVDGKISRPKSTLIAKSAKKNNSSKAVQPKNRLTAKQVASGKADKAFWRMYQDLMGFADKNIDGIDGHQTWTAVQKRVLRGRW